MSTLRFLRSGDHPQQGLLMIPASAPPELAKPVTRKREGTYDEYVTE